jgi:hypothetical protein
MQTGHAKKMIVEGRCNLDDVTLSCICTTLTYFIMFTLLFSLLSTATRGPTRLHLYLYSQMYYTVGDETMQNYYAFFSTYHANSQIDNQNGSHRLGSA